MKINTRQFALGLFLVLGILLYSCGPKAEPTPAPTEAPVQPAGPPEGTLMSWVDGSTLVFNGDSWIYQSDVSYYQFSLCVEAGVCMPEEDEQLAMEQALLDPRLANLAMPVEAQGTSDPCTIMFCEWAGGRPATEAETAGVDGLRSLEIASIGVDSGLPLAETVHGFKCAVDSPHPMAPACETSAFYLNGPPDEMDHTVVQAGAFCQNGQSFLTFDINIPEGGSIQSVNGDCEAVGDNRVLCSAAPGESGEGGALITCNGMDPATQVNGLPAAGAMQCLPGYGANPDSPAECGYGELLPAVQKDAGLAIARLQSSQSQSAGQVSLVVFQPNRMPGAKLQSDCPEPSTYNEILHKCVYVIPPDDLARASLPPCPPHFERDAASGECRIPTLPGVLPPNADGSCPDGTHLAGFSNGIDSVLFCVPDEEPAAGEENPCPPGFERNATSEECTMPGHPEILPPGADGSCPDGTHLNGFSNGIESFLFCVPDEEPAAGEENPCPPGFERNATSEECTMPGHPEILPPGADGSCPDGTHLNGFSNGIESFLFCVPDEEPAASEDTGCPPHFERDAASGECRIPTLPGVLPPNADGSCPDGTHLNGFSNGIDSVLFCVPDEEPAAGEENPCPPGFERNATSEECTMPGHPEILPPGADGSCPDGTHLNGFSNGIESFLFCVPDEEPAAGEENPCPPGFERNATSEECTMPGHPEILPPGADGSCPDGTHLNGFSNGIESFLFCVPDEEPAPPEDTGCADGWHRGMINGVEMGCIPDVPLGCPIGMYFDEDAGVCVSPGEISTLSLAGFHFDETLGCSMSDLPSGRYPGCPGGEPFDPATGACDSENIYLGGGKVLHTVEFNFDAPSCEKKDTSGGGGEGGAAGCANGKDPVCDTKGNNCYCP